MPGFDLQAAIMSIPGILMGFTFHEFGHAWVATLLGDDTPRRQGRVTLDPRAHLDVLGVLLIFLLGFGWAKPVYVNTSRFKHRVLGDILVSLAGVAMNFLLALLFAVVFIVADEGFFVGYHNPVLVETIWMIVVINAGLIVFNLIPLPPLDGFHVARYLLPRSMDHIVATLYRIGPFILMVLLMTPVASSWVIVGRNLVQNVIASIVLPVMRPIVHALLS